MTRYQKILAVVLLTVSMAWTGVEAQKDAELTAAVELFEQGDLAAAKESFTGLNKGSSGALPPYYLSRISAQQGDMDSAVAFMEEAIERDDSQSEYHLRLGQYYGNMAGQASVFKQMGLAKKSKKNFELAVELDGSNLEARSGLITYLLMAPAIAGGSEEDALVQAREVARQDPALGHQQLARVYTSMGDNEAAEREYRAALDQADPQNSNPLLAYGQFLTTEERFDEALDLYAERLATQPDDMPVVYQTGRVASISGLRLEQGKAAFEHYLGGFQPEPGQPGLEWAHYRLGLVYVKLGQPEQARIEYQAALAIDPEHEPAQEALKDL